MDESLDAACISLLSVDDDYAELERRAREALGRHGTSLVGALAELVKHVARVAADAENNVLALKGDLGVRLTPADIVHAAVSDTALDSRFELGGEEG